MFGKNQQAKADHGDGKSLLVNSIFDTIQGEGPRAGCAAIFIRLTGCNLRCHFCDTEFEKGEVMPLNEIVRQVNFLRDVHAPGSRLVVLTGGEPLRQQVIPLLVSLSREGYHVQIETAGTLWPEPAIIEEHAIPREPVPLGQLIDAGLVDLVCSPKTPRIHPEIITHCGHYKYICDAADGVLSATGLPVLSTQTPGEVAPPWRPAQGSRATIWLQPCAKYHPDESEDVYATKNNMLLAATMAQKHGYRLSLQLHKILGLP